MKVLRKEELSKSIGYCACYIGTISLKLSDNGTMVVDEDYLNKYDCVVLLFNSEDRFIDNNGVVDKSCLVDKTTGDKIYWLGGIKIYKGKDDMSSIDIIEATGRDHDYYTCNEEQLNSLLSLKTMLNHHKLFGDNYQNSCFTGDDNTSLQRNLMVMTDGNVRTSNILVALDNRCDMFFCREKLYEYGEAAICYWSNDNKYICIPVKLTEESYEFDVSRKIKSNIISIDNTIELIDARRAEEDFSSDVLMGIVYTSLINAEERLSKCKDEIVKELLMYWREYISNVPIGESIGDRSALSFKDRAAKLLGL